MEGQAVEWVHVNDLLKRKVTDGCTLMHEAVCKAVQEHNSPEAAGTT